MPYARRASHPHLSEKCFYTQYLLRANPLSDNQAI